MVAHHTSNGCNLRTGDLLGSGTISGAQDGSRACLTELTDAGKTPLVLPNSETRTALEDGDEIVLRARASKAGAVSIGFGSCEGRIASALPFDAWLKQAAGHRRENESDAEVRA
jgi:fumarylacetoacetase